MGLEREDKKKTKTTLSRNLKSICTLLGSLNGFDIQGQRGKHDGSMGH